MTRRAVVLTISDSVSAGTRVDGSGPAVRDALARLGWTAEIQVLPDDAGVIASCLIALAASGADAIFTTGGTGIAARDVTPEATRQVLDRELPGLAEAMRSEGRRFTPRAVLSRGIAGTRGRSLIVNLPGSPKGAVQSLQAIADVIEHAAELLHGNTEHGDGETVREMRTSEQ